MEEKNKQEKSIPGQRPAAFNDEVPGGELLYAPHYPYNAVYVELMKKDEKKKKG